MFRENIHYYANDVAKNESNGLRLSFGKPIERLQTVRRDRAIEREQKSQAYDLTT